MLRWLILRPPVDWYAAPGLVALFVICFVQEVRRPLRRFVGSEVPRLLLNGSVAAPALLVARLFLIPLTVWVAVAAAGRHFGLVRWLPLPPVARGLLAFVLLDYAIYWWHRMSHRVPFLWRFHNVHHTDLDLTVSTAFRFHFVEMGLSAVYRAAAVGLVGAGPIATMVYEFTMDGANAFQHTNWKLPLGFERLLNKLLVTPRMHGIHHSVVERETNSNWSVIFPFWDRLHRTLQLHIPQEEIVIGVPGYRDPTELTIPGLLALPFRRQRAYWEAPGGSHPDRKVDGDPREMQP